MLLPRGLSLCITLLAAMAMGLALRPAAHVFSTPLTEDAFYSLAVARNLALGLGFTIDGATLTNGFQPLFTLIEAAAYSLAYAINAGDDALAMRFILGISWGMWLATGALLGEIAAKLTTDPAEDPAKDPAEDKAEDRALRETRRWLAMLLYLGGFLTFMHHFNGLETGMLMLLYTVLAYGYQRGLMARRWGPAAFGAAFGLLVLTRIDAGIFVAFFTGWHALETLRRRGMKAAVTQGLMIAVPALLVSIPWWWFNYHYFGAIMPTSGQAQQAFAFDERRWRWILWALAVDGLPGLWFGRLEETFHDGIILSLLRAVVVCALVWFFIHRLKNVKSLRHPVPAMTRRICRFGVILAMALVALAVYYGASFIAFWFYYRYLFPAALPVTVAVAWCLAPVALKRPRASIILGALIALPALLSITMAYGGRTLHVETVYWEQLALVRRDVPETERVAAGQAGTLGYFRQHVVNVDGKVNAQALPYQDRMWDYLTAHNIRWFADWPFYVEKYLGTDPGAHGWRHSASLGIWQLWRYEGMNTPEVAGDKP